MTDPSTVVVPVELSKIISPNPADTTNAQKKKTRLVYCSDGVVEVTDESEPESNSDTDEDTDGGDAQNTPDGSGVGGFSRESNGGGSGSTGGSNGVGSSRGSSGGGSARSSTRSSRSSGRSARFATYPARTSCQPEWIVATNPRALRWSTWFWYYTVFAGCKTLDAADWAGEQLAWFFGITTPKYADAIAEYERQRESIREQRRQERREDRQLKERMSELQAERAAVKAARDSGRHSAPLELPVHQASPSLMAAGGEHENGTFLHD